MIRFFDICLSLVLIVLLLPLFIIIGGLISLESRGGVFYMQKRIGLEGKFFELYKFRSMVVNADKAGLLTVGLKDSRITKVGIFIRKYKIDELPQLFNVLKGEMSFVGPRPEVEKYVKLYKPEQRVVLKVRPGITDYASINFSDENSLLANCDDPEWFYINEIIPIKIKLNMKFINEPSIKNYFKVIVLTFLKIFK